MAEKSKADKVRRLLKDQSLRKFLKLKGNIYPDLVRVFYTNFKFEGNNLVSHVKGVEMEIDPIGHRWSMTSAAEDHVGHSQGDTWTR